MALLVIIGLAVVLLGGGSEPETVASTDTTEPDDSTEETATSRTTSTTARPTTTTTAAPPARTGPAGEITDIRIESGRYVFDYDPVDFAPAIAAAPALHVHFFWNTLDPVNAGTNGPAPGQWLVWDNPTTVSDPFFDVSRRPAGADAICVVVADAGHGVADVDGDSGPDLDSGNCFDLPDA